MGHLAVLIACGRNGMLQIISARSEVFVWPISSFLELVWVLLT